MNSMPNHWLADFCDSLRIFTVIVVTQTMVLIYSLSFLAFDYQFFNKLATISLLAQLIAINLVVILCKLRAFFNRFPVLPGVLLLSLMTVIITMIYTQLIAWLDDALDFGLLNDDGLVNLKLSIACLMTLLGLLRYFYIQQQWTLQVEAQVKSELSALQARIKPHFLYNSLNSIASLITVDAQRAEKAVLNLSGLFRKAFSDHSRRVPLAQEIEWVDEYLAIEQLRLSHRLDYSSEIDEQLLQHKIPILSIQPLVENAVLHGIQHLAEGGRIELTVFRQEKNMIIRVRNPYDPGQVVHGVGTGIENIKQRLKLSYDEKASLHIHDDENYFTAELVIPL